MVRRVVRIDYQRGDERAARVGALPRVFRAGTELRGRGIEAPLRAARDGEIVARRYRASMFNARSNSRAASSSSPLSS